MLTNLKVKVGRTFKYKRQQDKVNNAKSAFIMINFLISQGCHSGLIGQDDPGCQGGPGSLGGPGGSGGSRDPGGSYNQGGPVIPGGPGGPGD